MPSKGNLAIFPPWFFIKSISNPTKPVVAKRIPLCRETKKKFWIADFGLWIGGIASLYHSRFFFILNSQVAENRRSHLALWYYSPF
jgi:hypothetical protein